jgi:subtilase family serine protease
MHPPSPSLRELCLALAMGLAFAPAVAHAAGSQALITGKIDETHMVALTGNVRHEANAHNDRGPVGDSVSLDHLQLVLQRPAAAQAALDAYLEAAQTPGNRSYHQWLTAEQLGQQYGPAASDIATVSAWLAAHGFQINGVSPTGLFIDFSGSAGQIAATFKTEIHALDVNGEHHFANMSNPQIPAALAPAIAGIISLNDFQPHPMAKLVSKPTALAPAQQASPAYTTSTGLLPLVPADLATIYNFNPVYHSGTVGKHQSIVLIEDTDLFSNADYATFRKTFGLDAYKDSTFSVVHPGGCTDPGISKRGDDFEAAVDVEWAAASAPDADIVLASCANTTTNFGGFIALQSMLESRTPPAIVSISYGECEAALGPSFNRYVNLLYELATAEGTSVYVAAGDEGAASCDAGQVAAQFGISVSGYASTPYNLAAGGTDYTDTFSQTNSLYWSPTNSATFGSALSYIPEMPWNDSCANVPLSEVEGYATPYGASGFCNSALAAEFAGEIFQVVVAGSGGPSGCAYGETNPLPNTPAVSGTCRGYAKPIWQKFIAGNPNDGVRDIPDVSMFAANGLWGHYLVVCYSDPKFGGVPCDTAPEDWAGGGGTSFDAPILSGVQALVNQRIGFRQGNPDYAYYAFATLEYGPHGNPSCNSNNGTNACIFHDVTFGDIDVDCTGPFNCYDPSGEFGVLSVSSKKYQPAYTSGTGWDFTTGIGTVNVSSLVNTWAAVR